MRAAIENLVALVAGCLLLCAGPILQACGVIS